ncbi:DUF2076 domain-containing protein [Pseudomonas fragi]|uniref:DUF2076 domain-containing protein n=1 Tax=Pseudomonas fragi TaxID=296 RepID=UPI001476668B|nr:DUF2076 domain-containing protein [Pseudomonas fragi]NNB29549.1 DUF2076 domain-containing protein [Pseudomonas fragi]
MNSEEQTLIDGLFTRLQQAEAGSAPRDAQAQARINEHLARQPAATYYMAQALLVQEAALKQLDQQNRQLQAELAQAKAPQAAAPTGGSFLSGLFGSGASAPAQAPAAAPSQPPGSGGWRDGPAVPAQAAPAPQAAPAAPAMGGGFLGGALKTAAGVAGGVMLAQGISSLFHHNQQPQVIEEIIEQPTPASDSGWGSGNQQYANSGSGIEDVGLDDDGFFSDDDSYV